MEPYYLKCIKDGPFQPKTAEGDAKPESQWTPDESYKGPWLNELAKMTISMGDFIPLLDDEVDEDEEEVSDKEEVTQVKVLMALADDELTVGKSHARNGEWVDITIRKVNTLLSIDEDADWQNYLKDELLILKQAKLDVVTFQIQNTELTKLNHALQEQLKEKKKINEKWLTSSKRNGSKTKDWVERLNLDSKLPNFNTGRILVPESQVVNESLKTSNTPESSKDSEAEFLTPLPPVKNFHGATPSSEIMPLTFQPHSPKERPGLGIMKHTKPKIQDSSNKIVSGTVTVSETKQTTPSVPTEVKDTKQESKLNEVTKLVQMLIDEKVNSDQKTQESNLKIQKVESSKSVDSSKMSQDSKPKVQSTGSSKSLRPKPIQKPQLKRSESYKAQPYQYASSSKQILKEKAKPFPPCTHCGFNDHIPNDCRNYPECGICRSYDHSTSGHNRIIQIRGGVLAESSQSNESSIGVKCNTCGSTIHSTSDHNEFDHFKRCEKIQAAKARESTKKWVHKRNQPKFIICAETHQRAHLFDDKQGTILNANKEIVLIAPRRNDVYVLDMSSLTPNGACFFAKASKSDKPCTTCEKEKHHRASFKTKQNTSIRKCLQLLHMDLFGLVSPLSINHEKYTLVIIDEYSKYTWVYFLRKKSQAPKMIMYFIRMVENQNDVKVKQIKTDNGTEFRNHELESFCDEKGISQNFSSPYTPEQNGVAERKNRTLIEAPLI
ncbi:retrovirus-related pol polyprotein from transposon TNT 1-94 [Tanacetum coccineum]